jgi:CRP-like cAMP-binding protein
LSRRGVKQVPARRDLIREGETPMSVYLVLDGWACRYKQLPDGRRQVVAFLVPGDLCDLNVYILKEMDHTIGAISTIKVAEIAGDEFEQMMADHPRITQALFWNELVTNAIQREWTLNLGQRTAYERIAHLFVELFLRLEVVGLTNGGSCEFRSRRTTSPTQPGSPRCTSTERCRICAAMAWSSCKAVCSPFQT